MADENNNTTSEAVNEIDLDNSSPEEIQEYLLRQAEGETAEEETAPAEAGGETAETEAEEDASEPEAETPTAEEETPVAPEFKFTENADDDTFRAEADEYLASVELTPEVEQIINHFKESAQKAEELSAQYSSIGDFQTVERTISAFNRVLEYRQDADSGEFVPDASGIVELVNKDFSAEKRQIILDLNTQASDKYAGLTVFQEFIRDNFGLNDQGMANLETLLAGGGEMPVPRFTPAGIDERVAEAYWKSLERDAIQQRVENAFWALQSDETSETEKQQARQTLSVINAELQKAQAGLNAERKFKEETAAFAERQTAQIEQAAEASFISSVDALSGSLSQKIARALPFVEGEAAEVTADGYVSLIRQAYSEREWEAKAAQGKLAARGITHNWGKGRELLDRLFETEQKLAQMNANKNHADARFRPNPRAVENTQRAKANILRELGREELQVSAAITRTVVRGANKSFDKKLKDAPKFKAVRAKVSSDGAAQKPTANWDNVPPEKIQEYLTDRERNPYKAAAMGDTSAFG